MVAGSADDFFSTAMEILKELVLWLLVIGIAIAFPARIKNIEYRNISAPLEIKISKTLPPVIAERFADPQIKIVDEQWQDLYINPPIQLPDPQYAQSFPQNVEEEMLGNLLPEEDNYSSTVNLEEFVIVSEPTEQTESLQYVPDWVGELTPEQQRWLEQAQNQTNLNLNDFRFASTEELVQEKLQELLESERQSEKPNGTSISHPAVIVFKPEDSTPVSQQESLSGPKVNQHIAQLAQKMVQPGTETNVEPRDGKTQKQKVIETVVKAEPSVALKSDLKNTDREFRVIGNLELEGGLAITNDFHLEVRRVEDGLAYEEGEVNLVDGKFTIDLTNIRGHIVGRLASREGVIGEGKIKLADVDVEKIKHNVIEGVKLSIKPVEVGAHGRVVSAYSYESFERPVQGATIEVSSVGISTESDLSGKFRVQEFDSESEFVVTVKKEGFQDTSAIMISNSGISMLPKSMYNAFANIVSELGMTPQENSALIWGVIKNPKGVIGGVKVELEDLPDIKPIYFNQLMLPDREINQTTSSGIFVFLNVPEGIHSIKAHKGNIFFSHATTISKLGMVSAVEIEQELNYSRVEVKVFDAFVGEPLSAQLHIQSVKNLIEVQNTGTAEVDLPQIDRLSFMRIEAPAGYWPSVQPYRDQAEYLHLPLVRESWLTDIKTQAQISETPNTGVVVGFAVEGDYEAMVSDVEGQEQVVYFDSQGKLVYNRHGVEGGGFIIFNVPEGLRSVVLMSKNRITSRLVAVDRGLLGTLLIR